MLPVELLTLTRLTVNARRFCLLIGWCVWRLDVTCGQDEPLRASIGLCYSELAPMVTSTWLSLLRRTRAGSYLRLVALLPPAAGPCYLRLVGVEMVSRVVGRAAALQGAAVASVRQARAVGQLDLFPRELQAASLAGVARSQGFPVHPAYAAPGDGLPRRGRAKRG